MSLPAAYLDEFTAPAGYLEFASIGPVSRRARSAADRVDSLVDTPTGTIAEAVFPEFEAAIEAIARFMEVPPDRLAPVEPTSAGLFQVAFGLLGAGGNVVLPGHEFPANRYPWLRAAAAGGPEVRLVEAPDGRVTPDLIAAATNADTRAVVISLVDFQTGFRVDLDGMREAAGDALLVVDAIQGLGAVHRGIGPADVMVAGGQKWMRAGWGSGLMAVSETALERLAPTLTGWLGVEDAMDTDRPVPHPPMANAGRFQEGTPPIVGTFQMAAAVEVIALAGMEEITNTVVERAAACEEVVRSAGAEVLAPWRNPGERAGILCFRIPGEDPADTRLRLAGAGLITSLRGSWVRIAPHATTPPDVPARVGEALSTAG